MTVEALDRTSVDPLPTSVRVDVIVCAYTLDRRAELVQCLDGLHEQQRMPDDVVCVVDHNPDLLAELGSMAATGRWPGVRIIASDQTQGLSGARNTGVDRTAGDIVVFVDDDAVPEPDWLGELIAPFESPAVLAAGGHIEPEWPEARPWWFPPHLDWTVGCSIPTLPTEVAPIRNMYGASAAFRRDVLDAVGGFPTELGRVGANGAGCEETEVCIRIGQRFPGGAIVHVPRSRVRHHVSADRTRVRYVLRRCLAEGRSKALLSRRVGGTDATGDERRYAVTIASAVARDLAGSVRRPARLGCAAVLVAGLAAAALGFVIGSVART